jgi:arylsulfatase A-like enzyme
MKKKPNIVILVPDEMNTRPVGCYGQPLPVTPFMDQLAQRGARFENFFTCHPKCVPARVALLTAQHPHVGGHRTLELEARPEEPNLIRTLRENGYHTVMIGRNHMVEAETLKQTFDEYLNTCGKWTLEPSDPESVPPGSYLVGRDPVPYEEHLDVVRTDSVIEWIEKNTGLDRPFYLQVNYNFPHCPYSVPEPFYGKLDRNQIQLPSFPTSGNLPRLHQVLREAYELDRMTDEQWRELIACYYEMTTLIDHEMGRVFQTLEKQNLTDNTIFVIWVDHGDFAGEFGLSEKWDTAFYDCITHVPFIMAGPGIDSQEVPALMQTIDVLPTILDLVGVEPPKGIQGKSFVPVLNGDVKELWDVVLCQGGQERDLIERTVPVEARARPCKAYLKKQQALCTEPEINLRAKMIRDHRYKYIFHSAGFEEFYDLKNDPRELHNRAGDAEFHDLLHEYRLKMIAKLVEAEAVSPWQDGLEA